MILGQIYLNGNDLNAHNKCLTAKLLIQGYRKDFSFKILSPTSCIGDLVYTFKKTIGKTIFSFSLEKLIIRL